MPLPTISAPDSPALLTLCDLLRERSAALERPCAWPAEQLAACGRAGVYEWFLDPAVGGQGWSDAAIIEGYLALSEACLTTTFVITQRMGACRRIAQAASQELREELLPPLIRGDTFATVGISHLTTSRRHLAQPVLQAVETPSGFRLEGYSPWCTGARHADHVVLGATLDDGRQILVAAPMSAAGIEAGEPAELIGLNASQTGPVNCRGVELDGRWLLAGPVENVMQQGIGARTGGLQTSTLAAGLARAAIAFLSDQSLRRGDLSPATTALQNEADQLVDDLLAAAEGREQCSLQTLRTRANSLALRASQAALAAAKGAGYLTGHPAGRWCREALFFLVWSCPQPVMEANLCELAGLDH